MNQLIWIFDYNEPEILGNKIGRKKLTYSLGKAVILKMGTASAILSFVDRDGRFKSNQLCRRMYDVLLPGFTTKIDIDTCRHQDDWLKWGNSPNKTLVIRLNVTIGQYRGDYYGEEYDASKKEICPGCNRVAIICKDNWTTIYNIANKIHYLG